MDDYEDKIKEIEKKIKNEIATDNRRAQYISERIEMCRKEVLPIIKKLNDAVAQYDMVFKESSSIDLEKVEFELHSLNGGRGTGEKFVCNIADGFKKEDTYNFEKMFGTSLSRTNLENFNDIVDLFFEEEMPFHIKLFLEKEK